MGEKSRKEKKERKLAIWFRETKGELKKVSWPTPKDAWRLTVIVLIVMVLFGAFLGLLDWGFSRLIGLII